MQTPPPRRSEIPLRTWILAGFLLIGLIWWPFPEPTPRTPDLPLEAIQANPRAHRGKTVTGAAVVETALPRSFWIGRRRHRILVVLDDALSPPSGDLTPGRRVRLYGRVYEPANLGGLRLRRLDPRFRQTLLRQRVFLYAIQVEALRP